MAVIDAGGMGGHTYPAGTIGAEKAVGEGDSLRPPRGAGVVPAHANAASAIVRGKTDRGSSTRALSRVS
jgi:hypothetical protein